jgi:hypothetical protein
MDNPEKLATYGTQDEEKQNKNTTQYVLDGTIRKQTKMTYKRQYKQLEVSRRTNKDNILRLRIEENKYTIYKYYKHYLTFGCNNFDLN